LIQKSDGPTIFCCQIQLPVGYLCSFRLLSQSQTDVLGLEEYQSKVDDADQELERRDEPVGDLV
jgi:hypothetical protein